MEAARLPLHICAANASFNSTKSRSSIFRSAYFNAFKIAGVGPNPITRGSTPPCPNPITSAIGVQLFFLTASGLATIVNEAPSLIPEALPAVTVPSALKAGRNLANFSKLVLRGCSSVSNTTSPLRVL